MTTEIAVLNRLGIALATDSAVTIGSGFNEKVFDTADKLFELSPIHPVALMVNGNMDFLGVPWEIIVKDFREQNGLHQRSTIKEWMADFLRFVNSYMAVSLQKSEDIIFDKFGEMCSTIKEAIASDVFEGVRARGPIKKPGDFAKALKSVLLEVVAEFQQVYEGFGRADSLATLNWLDVRIRYSFLSDESLKQQFAPHPLTEEELDALWKLISTVIPAAVTTDFTTGIVIAGYGDSSIFPAIEAVEIEGKVLELLKYSSKNSSLIEDAEDAGQVVSYAQTDVIERLLGGADPIFVDKTGDFIRQAIVEAGAAIENALRSKRMSKKKIDGRIEMLEEIGKLFQEKYKNEASAALINESTVAFDRMIALMPKQELVNLAEALVSITAVERKASSDMGTVGGAIDVALITKHEGFVWIKRKQHFDPNLNPRYFWRRYGKNSAGGGYGAGANWSLGPNEGSADSQPSRNRA